jgi:hypothetical protein
MEKSNCISAETSGKGAAQGLQKLPKESKVFFKFWLVNIYLFDVVMPARYCWRTYTLCAILTSFRLAPEGSST